MAIGTLLLELESSVIDTNDLRVDAWASALAAHGYRVGRERILAALGDDAFVTSVLGADAEESAGEAIRSARDRALRRRLAEPMPLAAGADGSSSVEPANETFVLFS